MYYLYLSYRTLYGNSFNAKKKGGHQTVTICTNQTLIKYAQKFADEGAYVVVKIERVFNFILIFLMIISCVLSL
jgi:hypothetical protein